MQSTLTDGDTADAWSRLAPHLEAAMSQLGERDRTLLALRFYENKSGPEAAALLGIREAAAHKRTARALEKLRKPFTRRGVVLSAAAIAGAVSANSVQAAPLALAKTISVVAVAKGAAAGSSTLILVNGAMKMMTWIKLKFAAGVSVAVALVAGVATLAIAHKTIEEQSAPPTGGHVGVSFFSILERTPIVATGSLWRKPAGVPGVPGGVPGDCGIIPGVRGSSLAFPGIIPGNRGMVRGVPGTGSGKRFSA